MARTRCCGPPVTVNSPTWTRNDHDRTTAGALADGPSGDIPLALYGTTNGTWLVCDNQLPDVDQNR